MKSIVIANQKGGVAKTTTAVNLATGLADLGRVTVLIDADSQGNVADFLNLPKRPDLWRFIVQERRPAEVVQLLPDYPSLAVITGDESTRRIEVELNSGLGLQPATAIRDALRRFERDGQPHVVIIDTAPSLSAIQISALAAADWLLIPATPEYASETGIAALVQSVHDLRAHGSNLKLLGLLPTMVDARTIEHKRTIDKLHWAFPDLILPPVARRIAIAEAARYRLPIWQYDPQAALDYGLVVNEVARRIRL